ncbi:phenylalanine--tRNA ligase subunit beta [Candidatus Woesearchaeota archaeon]|nr:phenylalanine--tRNA ligase subunit beta [Candidatus Woesearchaeota archaeon]
MSNIIINRKVLEQSVGKKLTLDQLKERISMMDAVLEKVNRDELEVEVFPSRPDMLSEQGFARALASFIGAKTGLRNYPVKKSGLKINIDASVKEVRPFTACAIVKGIKFDDEKITEIIQLQEKLHTTYGRNRKKAAIGVYPLEKITFPVTFKAEKPDQISFIPLEADEAMTGAQILSRHKAGREYGALLEGKAKFPIFIDAKNEILSMPPIINSQLTGRITPQTKDVFIECSGFDYDALSICLNIIVTSLAEMGGEVYSLELIYPDDKKISPDLSPRKMKLDLTYVNKRLGLSLKEKEVIGLLEKMGFGYEKGMVLIPPYRADIMHQVDLAEDIAIAYGYENFTEELPNVSTIGEEAPLEKFARKVREVLVGLELMEVKNIHLLTELELNKRMNLAAKLITLKNALGENNTLRNSVLPSLLKNLQENQHNLYPQNIFEIGRIFEWAEEAETGVGEKDNLGIVLCHDKTDFTQIRQSLDALMRSLGLEAVIRDAKHASFIPGRVGNIVIEGKKVGIIGEIHPQALTNWGITMPVVAMEMDVEGLWGLVNKK